MSARSTGPVVGLELVYGNQRETFQPFDFVEEKRVAQRPLWQTMTEAYRAKQPFFLTAQLADGRYASSRFERLDPRGLLQIFEKQCGFTKQKTVAELLAEEKALRLNRDQLRHIRYVLNARYRSGTSAPVADAASLFDNERGFLEQYTREMGLPVSRYLTRTSADRLLSVRFQPVRVTNSGRDAYRRHKEWETYQNGKWCYFVTSATSVSGLDPYYMPQMIYGVERNVSGNAMSFDMVSPNPFNPSRPVYAVVDGRRHNLWMDRNWIKPRRERDGLSDAVIKAIRAGRSVEIRGTSKATGRNVSVRFSASGFTSAFRHTRDTCNRRQIEDWLR